ncbi:MAG: coproporphyrinogen dehydrogenase HemZ [Clostridia bacterium]|nr:coproporphyrinogen dehydrogenase HemZ [Clostridia bacterium]
MNEETKRPWGILTGIRPAKIATNLLLEGKSKEEILLHFIKECETTPEKAALAYEIACRELAIEKQMEKNGISIYIGIPFCPTRCLYCSFVTCGTRQAAKLIPDYVTALKKEIAYVGDLLSKHNRRIETVYMGGGTPTTLSAEQLETLFCQMEASFDLKFCKEFTVEAGRPDTITPEKLEVLKKHGAERISINPQSMKQETLNRIGRAHTPEQIREAVKMARIFDFSCINMDVIAGLPGESLTDFCDTLKEVEELSPENTTVHTMSIKRSSRLHEYLKDYPLTPAQEVAEMVDFSQEFLRKQGKHPYYLYRQKNQLGNLENVGYAKEGFDSLYNIYIMEEIQTILALGCGGVTKTVNRDTNRIERIFNVKEPQDYLLRLDEMLERKASVFELEKK